MTNVVPIWFGRVEYEDSLDIQRAAVAATGRDRRVRLLAMEHPEIVTLGRRANLVEDVLSESLKTIAVERGGEATLHDLGQLVIYPIADLKTLGVTVREWVERLTDVTAKTLASFQVPLEYGHEEPGVYTSKGKIAFIGLRVAKGISSHGISINVSNDLSKFALIRSCGCAKRPHDSVQNWSKNALISDVYYHWLLLFMRSFNLTISSGRDLNSLSTFGI